MKLYNNKFKLYMILIVVSMSMIMYSCKKFTDIDAPSNLLNSENVFSTDATLNSAIAGMYGTISMSSANDLQVGLTTYQSMCADELNYMSGNDYNQFLSNQIPTNDYNISSLWSSFYATIYQANSIIDGVNNSSPGALTDSIKNNAKAEAIFVRSFCFFYLTNLWGDVPLTLTTDSKINNVLPRVKNDSVYAQIKRDLIWAKDILRWDYVYSDGARTRVNKYAAMTLLARIFLYNKDWEHAKLYADSVINGNSINSLLGKENMSGIFVANNQEAIWQLSASNKTGYTSEGQYLQLSSGSVPSYALTKSLISSFDKGDLRLLNWTSTMSNVDSTYYYTRKYKNRTTTSGAAGEYVTYLRFAELYLIRAEAEINLGLMQAALDDINIIRNRAGLENYTTQDQAELRSEIDAENRKEFFVEYGHRWLDLKRGGMIDEIMGALKTTWDSHAVLWPIPSTEITSDHNLTQNQGYN